MQVRPKPAQNETETGRDGDTGSGAGSEQEAAGSNEDFMWKLPADSCKLLAGKAPHRTLTGLFLCTLVVRPQKLE